MSGNRREGKSRDVDRSNGWIVETGETRVEPVVRFGSGPPTARRWRSTGRSRTNGSRGRATDGAIDGATGANVAAVPVTAATDPSGSGLARIGRRGWLRPEVLALLAGIVFVVAALVKPWPNPAATPSAARGSGIAAAESPLASAAGPDASGLDGSTGVDNLAQLPAHDFRAGPWPPPLQEPTQPADPAWAAVDWSFLSRLDSHTHWGVSALAMPGQAAAAGTATPVITWAQEVAPWSPSQITVPPNSATYALAITWPSSIEVESISFDYLSYTDPRVNVTAVPAAVVATPHPGAPSASPAPTPVPTASPTPTASPASALVSGMFWIPPSSDLTEPSPAAPLAAWRRSPWSWPAGAYRIALATNAGTMIVALQLS